MSHNIRVGFIFLFLFALIGRFNRAEKSNTAARQLPDPFTAAAFQKHVVYLASDELSGRAPGSEGSAQAAAYLVQHFQKFGFEPLSKDGSWFQEFPLRLANAPETGKNILAIMPGQGDLKQQAIIVTAHYDHLGLKEEAEAGEDRIYNGADDNASGVSAMLLIAEAFAVARDSLPESHRTVIFASFDAEEQGLIGSQFYVKKPLWPLEKTAAIINFDGMGRLRMGKVFASDAETNPLLAQVAKDAARKCGIIAETHLGGHGRSDHAVFVDRGIPGMHFFTGANNDYHQVTDESKHLNFDGGAKIAWIGFEVVRFAVTHPDQIQFQKMSPIFDINLAINLMKMLGVVPVVNAQEGRYPQILYVLPNSLAAKQGFQAGDQITTVNGLPINRVEDALTIFQQLSFDDGIRFSILRTGEKIEANIPASVFKELSGPKSKLMENGKYEVQFRYEAPANVKTIYLAGEFNDWKPTGHLMDGPNKDGVFTTKLELAQGVYEYKFVIEGKDWKADPKNLYRVGKYNNSAVWVGNRKK